MLLPLAGCGADEETTAAPSTQSVLTTPELSTGAPLEVTVDTTGAPTTGGTEASTKGEQTETTDPDPIELTQIEPTDPTEPVQTATPEAETTSTTGTAPHTPPTSSGTLSPQQQFEQFCDQNPGACG